MPDPLPLSLRQVWALGRGRCASCSGACGRCRARSTLARHARSRSPTRRSAKTRCARSSTSATTRDGAALFWILPRRRDLKLLRLLVAYEIIWDFLDSVSERGAARARPTVANCTWRWSRRSIRRRRSPTTTATTHGATTAAICARSWKRAGSGCAALPSYRTRAPIGGARSQRAQVLALNHDTDPAERDAALEGWAASEFPGEQPAELVRAQRRGERIADNPRVARAGGRSRSAPRARYGRPAPLTSPGSRRRRRCSTATSIRPKTRPTATTATSRTTRPRSRVERHRRAGARSADRERARCVAATARGDRGVDGRNVSLQGQRARV